MYNAAAAHLLLGGYTIIWQLWRLWGYVDLLSSGHKCADVHCLRCGQVEGAAGTLACAGSHAAGAGSGGRQRGGVGGDAALPPQDTEEEVPLWGAGAVCAAAGSGGLLP